MQVKFALIGVLKVLLFFRVFSFPMLRTLIYSEVLRTWFSFSRYRFACSRPGIFENFLKFYNNIVKKLKNVVTPFCLERMAYYDVFKFFLILEFPKIFE